MKLPDDQIFDEALCADLSDYELSRWAPCYNGCPAIVSCLQYAVNNEVDEYMGGMNKDDRDEWANKAVLSGEKRGNISYRRCYQHLVFISKHRGFDDALRNVAQVESKIDYRSISMDAECKIQDQSEPRIDNVSELPAEYSDLSWHEVDDSIIYRVNSSKYIGEEFIDSPDLLVLGGEESIPVGLPQSYSWLSLLQKQKNITINNMSLPDGSIYKLSKNFFYHIKELGKPQTVILLVSNLYEYNYPVRINSNTGYNIYYNLPIPWDEVVGSYQFNNAIFDMPTDSITFRKDEKIKAIQESLSAIYSMEAACAAIGSRFIVISLQGVVFDILKECQTLPELFIFDLQNDLDPLECSTICGVDDGSYVDYNINGRRPGTHDQIHLSKLVGNIL